jgi:hypothetical protein
MTLIYVQAIAALGGLIVCVPLASRRFWRGYRAELDKEK